MSVINIVFVITQYIREVGFNARLSLFFCVILKKTRKIFVVSKIITTFAPLKYMRYLDAAIIGGICCICHIVEFNPIGAAASSIRKDSVVLHV